MHGITEILKMRLVDIQYLEWVVFTLALCTWTAMYFLFAMISPVFLFKKHFNLLSEEDKVDWNSRIVSTVSSIWCTIGAILILDDIFHSKDPLTFVYNSIYCRVYYSALLGYLLYDLILILMNPNLREKGIIIHHTLGLIAFPCILHLQLGGFPPAMFFLSEATTPFVNLRWYLDKCSKKGSSAYLYNGLAMWFGFLFLRILPIPLSTYVFLTDFKFLCKSFTLIGGIGIFAVAFSGFCLNMHWFFLMTKGVLKVLRGQSKDK